MAKKKQTMIAWTGRGNKFWGKRGWLEKLWFLKYCIRAQKGTRAEWTDDSYPPRKVKITIEEL